MENIYEDLPTYAFLQGGGEMGELIRTYDWSSCPLQTPDQWPSSLKTIIPLILHAKVPMFVWWGKELIQFYNDAYRDLLVAGGRHPHFLGKSAYQCWPESWGIIKPLIDQVLEGEGVYMENLLIPHYRYGTLLDSYWTFGYSPIYDEENHPVGVLVNCTETTQTVVSQQQLEISEAFSQQIFHSSPVAKCVFMGENMVIQMVNESMLTLLGRDRSIIGKTFMEVMPELTVTPLMGRLRQVLATGETYIQPEEKQELIRFGQPYTGYYHYTCSVLKNEIGENTGVIVAVIEITDQVRIRQQVEEREAQYRDLSEHLEQVVKFRTEELEASNEELVSSNEELQELNKQLQLANDRLQQFAYVASHDLQEPLRKIQTFSSLLSQKYEQQFDESGLMMLSRMYKAGEQMSTLINDLLAYSRLISPSEEFNTISLQQIIASVLETLELTIEQSGAIISIEPLPTVRGDAMQLGQLFQNLISNALKFTKKDQMPRISIAAELVLEKDFPKSLKPTAKAECYHLIRVKDEGVGFDSKYASRIFGVFERLHTKQEFAGTGIGLAICQRVVENHGGAIYAESEVNKGATFHVYLPA
ncbi:ATP-binding protein [Siphonobacter sp. SORGH_AS_0500]|uniref:PAS domain-containing sensor histidine kinase n=1 Tax=Siphonobacter sp. SORGH_AS_0500 TaxID=1864824 RepID=UPI002857160D|nr:ATP-binding protein [Siphonobacter sp. SORGH_AS_0500]MDR6197945.1 signal transduction histidine kinase [Siphonobacter sp. SORGH_AS_0500]